MGVVRLVGGHVTYRCAVRGTEAGPVAGFLNRDDSVALTIGPPGSGAVVTVHQGDEAVWRVASCVAREWSRPIELDHEVRWLPDPDGTVSPSRNGKGSDGGRWSR